MSAGLEDHLHGFLDHDQGDDAEKQEEGDRADRVTREL